MPVHRWTLAEEFAGCFAERRLLFGWSNGRTLHGGGERRRVKAQRSAARRSLPSAAKSGSRSKVNTGLHHAADLWLAQTRACSLRGFGASRALLVKPHPEHQAWKGCCSQE